jgi:tetratricopeptide (TPR) repeat protein
MKLLLVISIVCFSAATGFGQLNTCDSRDDCEKILLANPINSQAHYRIGEMFLEQKNYQTAALHFRAALVGDLTPKWTEVWSYVELGKIYDVTHQRDRAVKQYEKARATKDNTRGAINEATKYLESPYEGR